MALILAWSLLLVACARAGPSTALLTDAERSALQGECNRRARSLSRMEEALHQGRSAPFYAEMKGMLTASDPIRSTAEKIRKRLVGDMKIMTVRNLRMGLGRDPASWPPPDPEEWAHRERVLKSLPDLVKADVVFLKNVRARVEWVAVMALQDRDTFSLNRPNLERDIALLRSCLDLLRRNVDRVRE